MSHQVLPSEIQEFLRTTIQSLEQLEVLIAIQRQPKKAWTPEDVAAVVGLPVGIMEESLDGLIAAGLARHLSSASGSPTYCYEPRTPSMGRAVAGLARAYASNRLDIMRLMSTLAIERVRSEAANLFADAFIIQRKKEPGDG